MAEEVEDDIADPDLEAIVPLDYITPDEHKLLKAWELCRHLGLDHEPILQQVLSVPNVEHKSPRSAARLPTACHSILITMDA